MGTIWREVAQLDRVGHRLSDEQHVILGAWYEGWLGIVFAKQFSKEGLWITGHGYHRWRFHLIRWYLFTNLVSKSAWISITVFIAISLILTRNNIIHCCRHVQTSSIGAIYIAVTFNQQQRCVNIYMPFMSNVIRPISHSIYQSLRWYIQIAIGPRYWWPRKCTPFP